jgi:hypothetical protein
MLAVVHRCIKMGATMKKLYICVGMWLQPAALEHRAPRVPWLGAGCDA